MATENEAVRQKQSVSPSKGEETEILPTAKALEISATTVTAQLRETAEAAATTEKDTQGLTTEAEEGAAVAATPCGNVAAEDAPPNAPQSSQPTTRKFEAQEEQLQQHEQLQQQQLLQQHDGQQQAKGKNKGKKPNECNEEQATPILVGSSQQQERQQEKQQNQEPDADLGLKTDMSNNDTSDTACEGTPDRTARAAAAEKAPVAEKAAAAETATAAEKAAAAAATSSAARLYSIQEMLRHAVKSKRPFHPSLPIEGPNNSTETKENKQDAESQSELQKEQKLLQQHGKTEDDFFCSLFCAPGFRLMQRQGVSADAGGAAQGHVGSRRPRPPLGHAEPLGARPPAAPMDHTGPVAGEVQLSPVGGGEGPQEVLRGCPPLAARRKPAKPVRVLGSGAMQTPQPDRVAGRSREEAQPAWATNAHGEGLLDEQPRQTFGGGASLGVSGATEDADGGLAAFSLGDIRLAERAVESGMTLEGYFQSVKGAGPKGPPADSPAREINAAEAPGGPSSLHQLQQQKQPAESRRSTWGPHGASASPQATVGLGGVPLEHGVEEEFSFLEETEFPLTVEARAQGSGPHEASVDSSASTKARAKAAAAAAAAHAAAAAPSNPGAACVAAWFTTMLAAPPEGPDCQPGVPRGPSEGASSTPKEQMLQQPRRDVGNAAMQQQLYLQYQQRLHQQQAISRQHRGQRLDAEQGREAGRQLLSLIGVVPRAPIEAPQADSLRGCPPPQRLPGMAREEPLRKAAPTAAADLERQMMQRQHYLQQQQQHMQQLQQEQHMQQQQHMQQHMQHLQQQQHQMQQMQHPHVNPHFLPGDLTPSLLTGRPTARGLPGLLLGAPAGYAGPPHNNPKGPPLSRGGSGERNLLKLLHAGGSPFASPPEALPHPPADQ